jgi:predicted nucleic acid-binding protein
LPEWILTKSPLIDGYQRTLEKFLDPGEASMLALAKEMEKPLLIMDDLKARRYAKENGFALTGTLGVLMEAKKKGHILKLQEILQKMQATNFRISPNLISEALKIVGEET